MIQFERGGIPGMDPQTHRRFIEGVTRPAPPSPEEEYRRIIADLRDQVLRLEIRCALREGVVVYACKLHGLLRALADRVEFENEVEGVELAADLLKDVREALANPSPSFAPNAGTSGAGGDPPAQEPKTPDSVPSVPPRAYREEDE